MLLLFIFISGLPSNQAWGKNKKQFYHTDVDDGDIYGRYYKAKVN